MKDIKNLVSSALAQLDAVPKQELAGSPQIYWAGIPGNEADFPMNDSFDTFAEQASCFLNLESSYRSSLSPIGIRLGDRLTGKPVHVDISDEPVKSGIITNRNKFILGPSGSGKVFLPIIWFAVIMNRERMLCWSMWVIPIKDLCDMVGGYYFTYSETNPIRFNPFHIGAGESLDTEKKESIKTLLLAFGKKIMKHLTGQNMSHFRMHCSFIMKN